LNVKKIKGHNNLFRVKLGKIRVIYISIEKYAEIIYIGYRDDNTYNKY